MTARTIDPYAVLGIPAGASREEAARAHRRLAKEFHPDLNRGPAAAERMRRINEAWRILSNPARRARHDAGRSGPWTVAPAYGPRPDTAHWTTWATGRQRAAPRPRRPPRPAPVEPSFGDHPAVMVVALSAFALLLFIGTWLGTLAR